MGRDQSRNNVSTTAEQGSPAETDRASLRAREKMAAYTEETAAAEGEGKLDTAGHCAVPTRNTCNSGLKPKSFGQKSGTSSALEASSIALDRKHAECTSTAQCRDEAESDKCGVSCGSLRKQVLDLEARCAAGITALAAAERRAEIAETKAAALMTELEARCADATSSPRAVKATARHQEVALGEAGQGREADGHEHRQNGTRPQASRGQVTAHQRLSNSAFNDCCANATTKPALSEEPSHQVQPGAKQNGPTQPSSEGNRDQEPNGRDLELQEQRQHRQHSHGPQSRRSRGQQRRCCHDASARSASRSRSSLSYSSANTSRGSSPDDTSDKSSTSSSYCTSPATTRSARSSIGSSSSCEDEGSAIPVAQRGPDSMPTPQGNVKLVGPIARSKSNSLKLNNRKDKVPATSTARSGVNICGSVGNGELVRTGSMSSTSVTHDAEVRRLGPGSRGSGASSGTEVQVHRSTSASRASAKEGASRRGQGSNTSPGKGKKGHGRHHGADLPDDVPCIEVPVGREDEGLLLGGGRVLHKLKEELGGTLEYRRAGGVVLVYGQQSSDGPCKAAAGVRTALLLSDGGGGPKAEEYTMARLSMDDLLAECIALRGLRGAGSGARGNDSNSSSNSSSCSNKGVGKLWMPAPETHTFVPASRSSTASPAVGLTAAAFPWGGASAVTPPITPSSPATAVVSPNAATAAALAEPTRPSAGSVASNLPEGEYPPEAGSLRIIGENFGCVIDVAGEVAVEAAAAIVAAAAGNGRTGRSGEENAHRCRKPVGSATPVGPQDVLIWGPAGAVAEAKQAVAALVSGNACAEVVVGAARIKRRDRGFWVNCETMASGVTIEVDLKRGSVWVRGRPEPVENGRKDFHNKLASLFPGDFLAVPMPRAALKDLANAKGLASAAAEARAEHNKKSVVSDATGQAKDAKDGKDNRCDSGDEEGGVELWADWPCSCVRLRGEPAAVRCAAKALYASLAEWNTLEVSVRVDRSIVTRLLSRSGRILAGISSNMGITLLVEREKGVLRGRARTEQDAKEANRVLKLKVNALSLRRPEHPPGSATSPAPRPSHFAVSPALSSVMSEASVVSSVSGASTGGSDEGAVSSEDGQHGEKELTDPFDELQAFFAGQSLPDASSSSSDSVRGPGAAKKKSCVFDGVEDVPSGAGIATDSKTKNKELSTSAALHLHHRYVGARDHHPFHAGSPSARVNLAPVGRNAADSSGHGILTGDFGRKARVTVVAGSSTSSSGGNCFPSNGVAMSGAVRLHRSASATLPQEHHHHAYHVPHPRRNIHNNGHSVIQRHPGAVPSPLQPMPPSRHTPTPPAPSNQHHQQFHDYQARRRGAWHASTGSAVGVDHFGERGVGMHRAQHGAHMVVDRTSEAICVDDSDDRGCYQKQEMLYSDFEGADWNEHAGPAVGHRQALSRSSSARVFDLHESYQRAQSNFYTTANVAEDYTGSQARGHRAEYAHHGGDAFVNGGGGRGGVYDDEYGVPMRQQWRQVHQVGGHSSVAERSSSFPESNAMGMGRVAEW